MKSYKPINIVPIQVNTLGANADPPEIVALKQEFNDKLREIAEKTNEAIESLTGGLLDMGLWTGGEVIRLTSKDLGAESGVSSNEKDWGFRHHLGQVPRYALQFIPDGPFEISGPGQWPMLRRGVTRWTSTHVYFRPSEDIYSPGDTCIIDVLLIP